MFFLEWKKWVSILGETMIFEGLQLSCGVSCMVEREGFGMTESTIKARSRCVGNSGCVWGPL